VYIDHCISFSLCSAPKLFNVFADLLAFVMENSGISYPIHYLDDYLKMGPLHSEVCQQNIDTFISVCVKLGVPLTSNKLEGPLTSFTFLGIVLDTAYMEIKLPRNKLNRIQ